MKHKYHVRQPECHAFYMHNFNAIDILNKLSVGPNIVADVWKTKECLKKFFLYMLALCETNAYKAYTHFTNKMEMSRSQWKAALAEGLIRHGQQRMKKRATGEDEPSTASKMETRKSIGSGSATPFHSSIGSGSLPPTVTPERWKPKGTPRIPTIYTVSSSVAVAHGKAKQSPAAKLKESKKHIGPRGTCTACHTQVRLVCNTCLAPCAALTQAEIASQHTLFNI